MLLNHRLDIRVSKLRSRKKLSWRSNNLTSLHIAAKKVHEDIIQLFLSHGANAAAIWRTNSHTHLFFVGKKGYFEVLEIFFDNCLTRRRKQSKGYPQLFIAALNGEKTIISYLLSKGGDPYHFFEKCLLHLHAATQKIGYKAVRLLLKHGGKINPESGDFFTLFYALFTRTLDVDIKKKLSYF